MLNVIGYGRESTREQAENGFNLDEQERRIREYVDLYYENEEIQFSMIREEGASARSLKRPKMKMILDMIRDGNVDVLIVHNLDRLTRNLVDMQRLIELFEDKKVQLISLKENVDTETVQGRFFVSIIILIAQWEEETIGERVIRGKMESVHQGNYAQGRVPFGYARDPNKRNRLVINDDEAETVKRIFESIASGTYSYYTLSNELRKEKCCGRNWVMSRVEDIIKNKIYYGAFSWHGEEYENHQPAIISKELWMSANDPSHHKEIHRYTYMFEGKVQCSQCECICESKSTRKTNGTVYLYYKCPRCRTYYSEKKLILELESILDAIVRKHHIYKDYRIIIGRYKNANKKMESLLLDQAYYRFKVDEIEDMLKYYAAERDEAKKILNEMKPKILEMTFRSLSKNEQQLMMVTYLYYIKADSRSGLVTPVYTDEYKRIMMYDC